MGLHFRRSRAYSVDSGSLALIFGVDKAIKQARQIGITDYATDELRGALQRIWTAIQVHRDRVGRYVSEIQQAGGKDGPQSRIESATGSPGPAKHDAYDEE